MSVLSPARRRALPRARWVQPVQGYGITTAYGVAGTMWSSGYHTGVDFSCPTGTPVRAVAAARVGSVGLAGAYGNRVVLIHSPGFETWYCHLSSIAVTKGQQVSAGTVIGRSGATGNVSGAHLHLEVRVNGVHRDPTPYLSGAADAPSTSSFPTGAQPAGATTNAALIGSADSSSSIGTEIRRLTIVAAVVLGGVALVAVGIAQGSQPLRKKAN